MHHLPEPVYRQRHSEFPDPIMQLAMYNPLIHRIIDQYAHGEILTREEALCQMVVNLANQNNDMEKNLMELNRLGLFGPTV